MALTSILAPVGDKAVFVFARGNGGVLGDIVTGNNNVIALPEKEGGGGGGSEEIILNVTKGNLLKRLTDKTYMDL